MKYKNITYGIFITRLNRFIGKVKVNGIVKTVHIKNTGRCKELLVEGARVVLEISDNPERKTKYDLVSVYKNGTALINMDSQLPNALVAEWLPKSYLFSETANIKREVIHGDSRFDIFVTDGDRKAFIEVKGVTLENEGHFRFPDAPTERGVKHLRGLISCVNEGYEAYVIFVLQAKNALSLSPNDETHPLFGTVLREAQEAGVKVLAFDCDVFPDEVTISASVPVIL